MYAIRKIELILAVPSIEETQGWYERVLGWHGLCDTFDAEGRCTFGSVMWGDTDSVLHGERPFTGFNLSRIEGIPASRATASSDVTALIAVDDVDALYSRVLESGMIGVAEPENQPWGGRTCSLRDLNGFSLTFFQQVEELSIDEVRRRYQDARAD